MDASSVAAFWATGLLLIVVPGADWAFTVSTGLQGRSTLAAVGGLVLGYAGITAVVAAGVGVLIAGSPALLTALAIAGALYLMWHGAAAFARPSPPAVQGPGQSSAWITLVRGVGVSALNPKGLLIFLALLPQFANPRWSWPLAAQLGVLGVVFMGTCAVFYLCLGSFARRVLHTRPGAARGIARFAGAAMILIGALLVAERL